MGENKKQRNQNASRENEHVAVWRLGRKPQSWILLLPRSGTMWILVGCAVLCLAPCNLSSVQVPVQVLRRSSCHCGRRLMSTCSGFLWEMTSGLLSVLCFSLVRQWLQLGIFHISSTCSRGLKMPVDFVPSPVSQFVPRFSGGVNSGVSEVVSAVKNQRLCGCAGRSLLPRRFSQSVLSSGGCRVDLGSHAHFTSGTVRSSLGGVIWGFTEAVSAFTTQRQCGSCSFSLSLALKSQLVLSVGGYCVDLMPTAPVKQYVPRISSWRHLGCALVVSGVKSQGHADRAGRSLLIQTVFSIGADFVWIRVELSARQFASCSPSTGT